MLTASEMLARIAKDNPGRRFAVGARAEDSEPTALAYWDEKSGEWVMFLGKLIDGLGWARIGNLFINGEPVVRNWREV